MTPGFCFYPITALKNQTAFLNKLPFSFPLNSFLLYYSFGKCILRISDKIFLPEHTSLIFPFLIAKLFHIPLNLPFLLRFLFAAVAYSRLHYYNMQIKKDFSIRHTGRRHFFTGSGNWAGKWQEVYSPCHLSEAVSSL